MRLSLRIRNLAIFTSLALAAVGRADEATEIRALVQQLGSPRFADREDAEQRLLQNEQAWPFVKQASLRDDSPEIRKRCTHLLEKGRASAIDNVEREINEMSHRGEFGRATGVAFAWRHDLREKLSDLEKKTAQCLCDAVEKKTKQSVVVPKIPENLQIEFGRSEEVSLSRPLVNMLVIGHRIKALNMTSSMFLASEHMDCRVIASSIASVGGNAGISAIYESIVYIEGDATVGFVRNSLIVCAGNIDPSSFAFRNSTVIVGGKIIKPSRAENSIIRTEETELAELVRPWKAQELGIEPTAREGRIYAGKVAPKSPMAQAGVEADDILISLDGEKIADQAGAIKLLRQKSAEFLPFFVRVKRGDRELELTVPWTLPKTPR
jgi:hypothetical protein